MNKYKGEIHKVKTQKLIQNYNFIIMREFMTFFLDSSHCFSNDWYLFKELFIEKFIKMDAMEWILLHH